jgi:long-chain fatty acid transport protein
MLMPASGGMGGVSIARPQDVTSAINGNPGSLTQFQGTQMTFSGAWAEPTFNLAQSAPLPLLGVQPFSAKQTAPGIMAGNIGVTQSLDALGLPATFGIGFITAAAGGADFRHVPESNGTNSALTVFESTTGFGIQLTERLSVGTTLSIGTALFDGPFVEVGGMTSDYALRGAFGLDYALTPCRNVAFYYQTEQAFTFDNAVTFVRLPNSPYFDVNMDLPQNIGFGAADSSLMNGRLLVAFDVLYKLWDEAALFAPLRKPDGPVAAW